MNEEITQEEKDALAAEAAAYVRWAGVLERKGIKPWSIEARIALADPKQIEREQLRECARFGRMFREAINNSVLDAIAGDTK